MTDPIAEAREALKESLAWALGNCPTPSVNSCPEYSLHHQVARALLLPQRRLICNRERNAEMPDPQAGTARRNPDGDQSGANSWGRRPCQ